MRIKLVAVYLLGLVEKVHGQDERLSLTFLRRWTLVALKHDSDYSSLLGRCPSDAPVPGETMRLTFNLLAPKMQFVEGDLEENCKISYQILFNDILTPLAKFGKSAAAFTKDFCVHITRNFKAWIRENEDIPDAIEDNLTLCGIFTGVIAVNQPEPNLPLLHKAATLLPSP